MTYDEWVRQIHRELESRVPLELVKDIMNNAMRVAFEELYSNPAEADLNIVGIGRFYFLKFHSTLESILTALILM